MDFAEKEARDQAENEPMWYNLNALVSHWRDELGGLSEEGWLPAEMYGAAVKRNESLKAEFSEGGSPDELEKIKRGWPFQDHDKALPEGMPRSKWKCDSWNIEEDLPKCR